MRPAYAFVRRPSADMAHVELTHYERVPIDVGLARQQHDRYRAALAADGLPVRELPPLDSQPDGVFVEDVMLALPERFVMCRSGAVSRRGEVEPTAAALPSDRPLVRIEAPGTLDGGDVLRLGRRLYVGLSSRSNRAAVEQLAALLGPLGYSVAGVPMDAALHLKSAVTALDEDTILGSPAWIDLGGFGARRVVDVAPDEPGAGNALAVGGRVFVQAAHPGTAERVRRAGYAVELLDVSEFAKAEAALTCMSVLVPPAAG
jgi:dimethylargininase